MPQVFKVGSYHNKQFQIMLKIIEARHTEIEQLWFSKFNEISYFC